MKAKKAACLAALADIRKEHNDPDIALCFYADPRKSNTGHTSMMCQFYSGGRHHICVSAYDRFGSIRCPEYNPMKGA